MKTKILYILVLVLVSLSVPITVIAISAANETSLSTERSEEDFRVIPNIMLMPVVDVIEEEQDGIFELRIYNPSVNDVALNMELKIILPSSGIYIYSEGEAWTVTDEIAYAPPIVVPPGTFKTIPIHIKADENAKIGSHSLEISGLYNPGNNKKLSSPIALMYSPITVKEPSKEISTTSPESASVYLHGEKTIVTVGEDILLSLSAVNMITKPTMRLQLILKVPSGMSVSSAEFIEAGAGMYTATYAVEPGKERHIGVNIKTNQAGEFYVEGFICYYFGEDKSNAEYRNVALPVKVKPVSTPIERTQTPSSTPTEDPEELKVFASLNPVISVIDGEKDGIVYLSIANPPLNEVILHIDVLVMASKGIHIYPDGKEWTVTTGAAYVHRKIYPGKATITSIHLKADKNAKIGSYTLMFTGLYYPENNKNLFKSMSIQCPITVKEPSKEIPPTSKLTSTSPEEAIIYLHGEKTSVTVEDDIILSLSAINLITKPTMTLQLILKVPSGMSITSTEFVESGAGQYTATYTVEPGKERYIGVNIKTNQVGDFNVEGDICYFFGGDKSTAEYKNVKLPVKVNHESTSTETTHTSSQTETSGFEVVFAIAVLFAIAYLVGRGR